MALRTTATFNYPLTTYAQGIAQDRLAAFRLANLLCPIVQVATASGSPRASTSPINAGTGTSVHSARPGAVSISCAIISML